MELLVIKCGEKYIHIKNRKYTLGSMEKASVFPIEALTTVKQHLRSIYDKGLCHPKIYKLIILEERFQQQPETPGRF